MQLLQLAGGIDGTFNKTMGAIPICAKYEGICGKRSNNISIQEYIILSNFQAKHS